MSHFPSFVDIFIVEILVHGPYPVQQIFNIQVTFIHWDIYLCSSSQLHNNFQEAFIARIFPCSFFNLYFFTLSITIISNDKCSPLHCFHCFQPCAKLSHFSSYNTVCYRWSCAYPQWHRFNCFQHTKFNFKSSSSYDTTWCRPSSSPRAARPPGLRIFSRLN
jgi:hypothetical protein